MTFGLIAEWKRETKRMCDWVEANVHTKQRQLKTHARNGIHGVWCVVKWNARSTVYSHLVQRRRKKRKRWPYASDCRPPTECVQAIMRRQSEWYAAHWKRRKVCTWLRCSECSVWNIWKFEAQNTTTTTTKKIHCACACILSDLSTVIEANEIHIPDQVKQRINRQNEVNRRPTATTTHTRRRNKKNFKPNWIECSRLVNILFCRIVECHLNGQ